MGGSMFQHMGALGWQGQGHQGSKAGYMTGKHTLLSGVWGTLMIRF